MKTSWLYFTIIVAISFFYVTTSTADTAEFRTVISRNDQTIGGEFHLDLEMRIISGTSPRTLSSMTVDIYYSSELSAWPSTPSTGWGPDIGFGYTRSANKNPGYYRVLVLGLNVNADGVSSPPGIPPGWDVTTSWQKVVTLMWTINTATSANIYIEESTDAAAYFNNYTNAPTGGATEWTVSNQDLGDVSLPVELTSFEFMAENDVVTLQWVTESEINNLGFEVYRALGENADYTLLSEYQTNIDLNGQGNSSTRREYHFTDASTKPQTTYWYKLADVDYNGVKTFHGPISITTPKAAPTAFKLRSNYPNPFNPSTTIRFDIPKVKSELVETSIIIYNTLGQATRRLYQEKLDAGSYEVLWDGGTDAGYQAPSGIYFVVFKAGKFSQTQKILLVK